MSRIRVSTRIADGRFLRGNGATALAVLSAAVTALPALAQDQGIAGRTRCFVDGIETFMEEPVYRPREAGVTRVQIPSGPGQRCFWEPLNYREAMASAQAAQPTAPQPHNARGVPLGGAPTGSPAPQGLTPASPAQGSPVPGAPGFAAPPANPVSPFAQAAPNGGQAPVPGQAPGPAQATPPAFRPAPASPNVPLATPGPQNQPFAQARPSNPGAPVPGSAPYAQQRPGPQSAQPGGQGPLAIAPQPSPNVSGGTVSTLMPPQTPPGQPSPNRPAGTPTPLGPPQSLMAADLGAPMPQSPLPPAAQPPQPQASAPVRNAAPSAVPSMPPPAASRPLQQVQPVPPAPSYAPPLQPYNSESVGGPQNSVARAAAAVSGSWVQLGSMSSPNLATKFWEDFARRYPQVLEGLEPDILQADVPGQGTFYRVRVGPFSPNEASSICAQLEGNCLVVNQ